MTDNGATRKATRKRRRPEEEFGESVSTGAKEGVGPNSGQTGGLASFLRKRKSKKLLGEAEDDRMEAKYSKGGWVWMGVYRQVRAAPVSMEVSRRHRLTVEALLRVPMRILAYSMHAFHWTWL